MINPHILLGVDEDADDDVVRKRYKTVSKMFHPDKHQNDKSAVAIFQLLREAYDKIKESRKKIVIPKIPKVEKLSAKKDTPSTPAPTPIANPVVPGTNITENDIRILGEQIKDPWFHQDFSLTDFFGDVAIPEDKKSGNMRPSSSRR